MSPSSPDLGPGMRRALRRPADLRRLAARPEGVRVGVVGGSMAPAVRAGDEVRVRACRYVWPGEVILFETGDGGCMLHRALLEVPGLGWLAEVGDAGEHVGLLHRSRLIGRADVPKVWPPWSRYLDAAIVVARAAASVARRGDWLRPLRAER